MIIPVITVWQPWAAMLIFGDKRIENRSWHPSIRSILTQKPMGVHAAKKFDGDPDDWEGDPGLKNIPRSLWDGIRGAILGYSIYNGFVKPHCQEQIPYHDPYQFGWRMDDPVPFKEPIFIQGKQGIWVWKVPPEIEKEYFHVR